MLSDYKIIGQINLKKSNISLVAITQSGNKLDDFDNILYFENNQYFVLPTIFKKN